MGGAATSGTVRSRALPGAATTGRANVPTRRGLVGLSSDGYALAVRTNPVPRLSIDLRADEVARWSVLRSHAADARALVAQYLRDLAPQPERRALLLGAVEAYETTAVPSRFRREIDAVAALIGAPRVEVLAANLYYDAFRVLMGCTAFAVDDDEGPLHARNLDWWTEDALLARSTVVCDVQGAAAGPFSMIGWPGLVGAFSGIAEGRFAITMNAVLSEESPTPAISTPMLIRDVLETAVDYDEAKERLARTPIASDCLLLLTGAHRGELCVIERTSTRAAVREVVDGVVAVTNDYRALDAVAPATTVLAQTAETRLECASRRACAERPRDPAAAFAILSDPGVKMLITVQQMVLHAATGRCEVLLPG